MLVKLAASFLFLLIRLILFSFSMSNTEGTFSDELVSVATLGLGSELAEAEEDLTVAV